MIISYLWGTKRFYWEGRNHFNSSWREFKTDDWDACSRLSYTNQLVWALNGVWYYSFRLVHSRVFICNIQFYCLLWIQIFHLAFWHEVCCSVCQDINECRNYNSNNCTYLNLCNNTLGGYTCSCPKNNIGDGYRTGTGCNTTLVTPGNNVLRFELLLSI